MRTWMLIILLLALMAATAAGAQGTGRVPLAIDLPKAVEVGTESDISGVKNLEQYIKGRAPRPLHVPQGTVLVSKGKPVSYSGGVPVLGDLEYITDGDKEANSVVELGLGPEWVQVDLGETYYLQAVCLWHDHRGVSAFFDVVVQASDDAEFGQGVHLLYNNDDDNSLRFGTGRDKCYVETHFGRQIPANNVPARYVRIWSNGNTNDEFNKYVEVEVYATKSKE
jgi:hypothetical protein